MSQYFPLKSMCMIYFMDIENLSKQLEGLSYFFKVICTLYFNLKNDNLKSILVTAYQEGIKFLKQLCVNKT